MSNVYHVVWRTHEPLYSVVYLLRTFNTPNLAGLLDPVMTRLAAEPPSHTFCLLSIRTLMCNPSPLTNCHVEMKVTYCTEQVPKDFFWLGIWLSWLFASP
jgi:hypothetical protein